MSDEIVKLDEKEYIATFEASLRARIIEYMKIYSFERGTKLVAEITEHLFGSRVKQVLPENYTLDIPGILNKMVEAGELIEIEYVTEDMNYRVKSIYFLSSTKVLLRDAQHLASLA